MYLWSWTSDPKQTRCSNRLSGGQSISIAPRLLLESYINFHGWCSSSLLFRIAVAIFSPRDPCDDNKHVICISDLSCHKNYMFIWQTTLSGDCKRFAIFLQLSFWQFVRHRRSFAMFTRWRFLSLTNGSYSEWWISFPMMQAPQSVIANLLLTKLPNFCFLETANHP